MRGRKLLLLNAMRGGNWLANNAILYDDFLTAEAAPLTSPRTCEPGPGTLVVTDANDKLSISGGLLTHAQETVYAGVTESTGLLGDSTTVGLSIFEGLVSFSDTGINWAIAGLDSTTAANNDATGPYIATAASSVTRVKASTGEHVMTSPAIVVPEAHGVIIRSNGAWYVANGKLAWVDGAQFGGPTTLKYAQFNSYCQGGASSLDWIWAGNLATSGYPEYGADFSTVTDTEVNQASKNYDCEANCHVTGAFTCENTKYVYIYIRYTDANNWVRLAIGTDRVVKLEKNVATSTSTIATGSTLTDAVEYKYDLVANGSAVEGFIDNVTDAGGTIADHATVAQGRLEHDLASNDLDVTSHPYPALGIATDRVIAPATTNTYSHTADCLAYIRNVTLPSANSIDFQFRISGSDEVTLQLSDDGSLLLLDNAATEISAGAATVSDGDDVAVMLDGVNGEVFVAGTSAGTTSTIAVVAGISGKRLDAEDGVCDSIELFPRELTLPAALK